MCLAKVLYVLFIVLKYGTCDGRELKKGKWCMFGVQKKNVNLIQHEAKHPPQVTQIYYFSSVLFLL